MENVSKTYNTRQKRKSVATTLKSRVDWKRTKRDDICQILDSDESFTSEEEELDQSDEESEDSSTDQSEDPADKATLPEEDGDEGHIRKPRLKSKSATIESDSSSDSDGPGEKVNLRRSCVIKEDDSDEEVAKESSDKEIKAQVKKRKRQEALKKLAAKQKSRKRTTSREATEGTESPDDAFAPLTPESLGDHDDSDDMSDFIVQDEEESNGAENPTSSYKELFRKHHISLSAGHDLPFHLQKVIKAFLINITDEKFLATLYKGERKKRYAKDMLKSLNHLDQRIITPRLEKLTASCRWSKRYKERINSYPEFHVRKITAEEMSCEACDLHRYCGHLVTLSGQAYDNQTLESDDFLQNDWQKLVIGKVCANRTEAYHQLRHYKYFLYQRCIPFIEETKGESANEIVELALSKMEAENFLGTEVSYLESYLNEADYFQEENKDWLLS
ncbi:coiled-coil domain-containing protein 82 isoform X1 [Dendrobates tinctorius]|uniref:coiled-coil domain-containing protein 82 isoform X1 n=1 Tax=Dendrobates tinctorius TaxID=92724 RepID=UPI003CCA2829